MEISFIHTQMLVHLHVNKTNFHMKGFALGLALKQRQLGNCLLLSLHERATYIHFVFLFLLFLEGYYEAFPPGVSSFLFGEIPRSLRVV